MSFTVQMWHWLVDEELVGSKECHDLRPSLTRHLTSTWGKDKQACETPSRPSRWRMISAKVVQYRTLWDMFKFLHMKYQGQTQASMSTCNKQQIQNSKTHIFTHLHTSSQIFTHLHTSSHLGDGSQSVWDVSELEAELGRELSRKFEVFRSYVSNCRKHGYPATPVIKNSAKSQGVKCTQLS